MFLICTVPLFAQTEHNSVIKQKFEVKNDTLQISAVSISPYHFKVLSNLQKEIDTSFYTVDFSTATLVFKPNLQQKPTEIVIEFTPYPDFLTKKYVIFDKRFIVPTTSNETQLYSVTSNKKSEYKPFEGLNTTGNISRGLTVGNNQNGVVNSTLDLQIGGKISEKVTLKASIVDTNLPIQENGNTYKLNEFDQVFIELSSEKWQVNAGDIYLNNRRTNFLNFNKKVSGLGVKATIENENSTINVEANGALVKGKYNKIQFTGQEGNQGPYLLSNFGNKYVLILSNTEQIYVNGIQLKRGEENDYIIDYNTAEITFNTTFPITSNSRITAEYQYTDRVFTRFVTYNNVEYKTDKLTVNGFFYNENDLKNQPLEQDLSNEQKQLLANAGNNTKLMVVPSAYEDAYSEDKILYKKTLQNTTEFFEYSTNETDDLYAVSFSYIGKNLGSYQLKDVIAIGKIYEYIGEKLGDYNPIIQLVAPSKLQVSLVKAEYNPSKKTAISIETAVSNTDSNLFSNIDDSENKGLATKIGWKQLLFEKKWSLKSAVNFDYLSENFNSVERVQSVEFNRDWNLESTIGAQKLWNTSLQLFNKKNKAIYEFETLSIGDDFTATKHKLVGSLQHKNSITTFNNSFLSNNNPIENGTFGRFFVQTKIHLKKAWIGAFVNSENNERTVKATNNFNTLSHKFSEYEGFFGVGDSTKVFSQFGFNYSATDSIQNNQFERVTKAKTYYLKSSLIHSESANLNAYINYREVDNLNFKNEASLNSKITYQQQLFNQFINFTTSYQTISGTLPLQDYTYIKTEPGQGFYTWIDYNNNGIKDLNEFEIAQFADQAEYLRIVLPSVRYIPTYQNKVSQSFNINPIGWSAKKGFKKIASYFYNQTYILLDRKQQKQGEKFNLNPFTKNDDDLLSLNYNFNNSFYFNRGKKQFSTTYNYTDAQNNNTTTIDNLENNLSIHKVQFEHKFGDFIQFNFEVSNAKNQLKSFNYSNRNYHLNNQTILPKLSYYYNSDAYFSISYELKNKENTIENLETLNLKRLGMELNYSKSEKNTIKADFNYFNNTFVGNSYSPVGYQMLEGLQPGKNYTWSLLFFRNINSYLNLNINYLGRKSETSSTIHTGSIQLKALF